LEFERRQFFSGQKRVRNIVLKAVIAHQLAFLKRFGCGDQANPESWPDVNSLSALALKPSTHPGASSQARN
jgi:hypothetical protein